MELSVSHSRMTAAQVMKLSALDAKALLASFKGPEDFNVLERRLGIGANPQYIRAAAARYAEAVTSITRGAGTSGMDAWSGGPFGTNVAAPAAISTPSIVTPIQFLQYWVPGFVEVVTAARMADEAMGMETIGNWRDEQIVVGMVEPMGAIDVYKDNTNIPLADWNPNWFFRTVVRLESGILVGRLEQERASAAMLNSDAQKRGAAALRLEIWRNLIGLYGFNAGSNSTYGFLNDPGLGGYVTVAAGAAGLTWVVKTYLEIIQDLITAFNTLRTQSQNTIDPFKDATTLAIPMDVAEQLSKLNELGSQSVVEWLNKTYPRCRVVVIPQLDNANGGANVFYLYADAVRDGSTDDKRTWAHFVPTKFMALGVEQRAKAYVEDFTNATAGAMCKRPFAVVRYTGC